MPIDDEFRLHLRRLSEETHLKLLDEEEEYKRQVVFEARNTGNPAAVPIAYSKAKLHAFKNQTRQKIERYLSALEKCRIEVDDEVEKEMLRQISHLTSVSLTIMFPPFIRGEQVEAVRRSHAQAMMRAQHQLYREAANRLREEKIKARARAEAEARVSGSGSVKQLSMGTHNLLDPGAVTVGMRGTPKKRQEGNRPDTPDAMPEPIRESKPIRSGTPKLNYRSEIKRAIVVQLTRNPGASDLNICRALDEDGAVELPKGWAIPPGDRLFREAYMDRSKKARIAITISKVRADMRKCALLPAR